VVVRLRRNPFFFRAVIPTQSNAGRD